MTPNIDLLTPVGTLVGLLPEVVLTLAILGVLLLVAWKHQGPSDSREAGWAALVSIYLTGGALVWLWLNAPEDVGMGLMFATDTFRFTASALILLLSSGAVLCSLGYLERERLVAPEYYVLLLLAVLGMLFMINAQDLIILFLGLETMSVSIYVLAAYNRASTFSAEAGLKYFLMGSFASGFLLYGIALTYGAAGSTNLQLIAGQYSLGELSLMAKLGLGLLLVGFGFKIAAVPFHMWAPDTYDGAPTPVTGFMATAVKTAGFVALARVLFTCFQTSIETWQPVLWGIAVASMVLGNLVAVAQKSLKRMLAYSSVAHAGYLVASLVPGTQLGISSMTFYLLGYGITSIAAFALLAAIGRDGERDVTLSDIAGLAGQRPWLAFFFSVVMLSLLGFPGTIGFMGKWYIISSLVAAQHTTLSVIIVLTSVISAGYYLPVIMAMYMRPARAPLVFHDTRLRNTAFVAVLVSVIGILVLGVWPTKALELTDRSAGSLPVSATETTAGN